MKPPDRGLWEDGRFINSVGISEPVLQMQPPHAVTKFPVNAPELDGSIREIHRNSLNIYRHILSIFLVPSDISGPGSNLGNLWQPPRISRVARKTPDLWRSFTLSRC